MTFPIDKIQVKECPQCGSNDIARVVEEPEMVMCFECDYEFNEEEYLEDQTEQQRRDEKNGLYPDREDVAN